MINRKPQNIRILIIFLLAIVIWGLFYIRSGRKNNTASIAGTSISASNTAKIKDANKDTDNNMNYTLSSWLWKSPTGINKQEMISLFEFCNQQKIETIYLTIDDYLSIYGMKSGTLRESKLKEYTYSLEFFIASANNYGIKVQALGGDQEWARRENHSKPLALLDFVTNYNNQHDTNLSFDGIQFDIEPYNLPDFNKNQTAILKSYLDLMEEITTRRERANLVVGFTMPYWFDNEDNNLQNFSRNSDKEIKPVAYYILDILNKENNNYVVILAYRNFADGIDGSINHSESELDYAEKFANNVSVIIGQETAANENIKKTFDDTSKEYLRNETVKIVNAFKGEEVFQGIAIHHLLPFKNLP